AAVVVGAERAARVPVDRRGVGHAVAGGVARAGGFAATGAEEERDDSGTCVGAQVNPAGIVEQPLDLVVLVVAMRAVDRAHLRVAQRDLPHDDPLLYERGELREIPDVSREVVRIPPGIARAAGLRARERGVAVAVLGEG